MKQGSTDRPDATLPPQRTLILCGGLQSSGTTLISYCFLQRADTNGVLDADNDLLPVIDPSLAQPFAWYKTTVSSFRLSEIAQHYRDAGWDVRTLLVLRDLRAVWASLRKKSYGRNGITAEDPPLRLRVRRFIDDWRHTQSRGDATMRYEDFVATPTATLQRACQHLGLPWDVSMLTWPKPPERIADRRNGNGSFWDSQGKDLAASLGRFQEQRALPWLPAADLHWLQSAFEEFNAANGYPLAWNTTAQPAAMNNDAAADKPSFEVTRRYKWETAQKPFRWLLSQFGRPNTTLIDRRSRKRAA
ncbi:MAG: sulfotransferase [Burkholderiales bacterium]